MSAIARALLAVMAAAAGDVPAARSHLVEAHRHARATARRERQIVDIATVAVAGDPVRAAGLAREHVATYPDDAELLARIAPPSAPGA